MDNVNSVIVLYFMSLIVAFIIGKTIGYEKGRLIGALSTTSIFARMINSILDKGVKLDLIKQTKDGDVWVKDNSKVIAVEDVNHIMESLK